MSDRLMVVEETSRFLVVHEDDPGDWLCAFAKTGDFPAERWAQDMARTYNARHELSPRRELSRTSSRRRPAASDR